MNLGIIIQLSNLFGILNVLILDFPKITYFWFPYFLSAYINIGWQVKKVNTELNQAHPSPKYFFNFQTDVSEMFGAIFKGHFDKIDTIKMKNIGWGLIF